MSIVSAFIEKIKLNRPLYAQVLFAVLAFFAMAVLSYIFVSRIVHSHLVNHTETMLSFEQARIEADLMEHKMPLEIFSNAMRDIILNGGAHEDLQDYIDNAALYLLTSDKHALCFNGFHGYFETLPGGPVHITGIGVNPPEDLEHEKHPWHKAAVAANGNIAETLSFMDIASGEAILTYSLGIFDDEDNRLGIINLRIRVNAMGKEVIKTALAQGGYGMLLNEDLVMLAHPNQQFVGTHLGDLDLAIAGFENDLREGIDVSERPILTFRNEAAIAFFRQLSNGWYLGLVTPKGPYYQSVTSMMVFLGIVGIILATALICILIRIDAARNKSDMESKYKSAFLANMSHEIRTPMNAIIGMTTIGKSAGDAGRKDYCFTKIEDASNHLLGVINDILDMSKIEANKFDLSPAEFNFEKMLQRVVNVVNIRMDEKRQKFTIHIDPAIPQTLIADDQRLAQVITNLLGNAIKFTPEYGAVNLDARFAGMENDICTIQISVTDTGIGIRPEQQERLFQSFEQAETSTTRKFGGTGLGLAISRSIVEMMGGSIWLRSEIEKGSTFTFTIKAKRGTSQEQGFLTHAVHWSNARILTVDDDQHILDYFKEIAQGLGVFCETALSGEEAIELVRTNGTYHIYFIDWKMPGMNGIQLARELKSQLSADSIVIMISSTEWSAIAEDAKNAGVDKFLAKPLFPSAIADAIAESLGLDMKLRPEEEHTDITGLFEGRRILLAEDVEINREIVLALFEPTLLEIDCAENGVQAVEMFAQAPEKYDMILMDVQMPEMDGCEATRCIRAIDHPEARAIRIIAMTANVFREDVEKCLEAGMDNHLGKPLNFDEVVNMLRAYLPRKKDM